MSSQTKLDSARVNADSEETAKLVTTGPTESEEKDTVDLKLLGEIGRAAFSYKLTENEFKRRVEAATLYDPFALKGNDNKAKLHSDANRLKKDDYSTWAKLPVKTVLSMYMDCKEKGALKKPNKLPLFGNFSLGDQVPDTEEKSTVKAPVSQEEKKGKDNQTLAPESSHPDLLSDKPQNAAKESDLMRKVTGSSQSTEKNVQKYNAAYRVSEGSICHCCGLVEEPDSHNISSAENPYTYRAAGAGYVMFFKLNVVNLVIIGLLCIVNIYKLLVNLFGGYCVSIDSASSSYKDNTALPVCYLDWVTIHSAANYGVTNIDYAERYLLLIMFFTHSFFLAAGNYYISYIAEWIDGRDLNASDYAVLIKGVANEYFTEKNKKRNLLGKVIERIGIQATPEEAARLGKTGTPFGFKVVHIDYIYNYFEFSRTYERLSELKRSLNTELKEEAVLREKTTSLMDISSEIGESSTRKRYENPKTGKEAVTMTSCSIIKQGLLPMFNSLQMPKFQPQTYERMSLDFQLRFIETIYLNDKLLSMRQMMESNDPKYYRGAAIVSFEQREHMIRFLKEMERFSPTDGYESLNGLAMVTFRSIANSFKEKTGISKFNVRRAAHPDEIVWRNTGVTALRKGLMVFLSIAALTLLIGITVGSLYLLKSAQQKGLETEKARYRIYSGIITLVIVIVNFVIGYLVVFLSRYEMESNMAVTVKSIFVRVILVRFVSPSVARHQHLRKSRHLQLLLRRIEGCYLVQRYFLS